MGRLLESAFQKEVIDEIKAAEARKAKLARRNQDSPGIIVKGADNLMIKLARLMGLQSMF